MQQENPYTIYNNMVNNTQYEHLAYVNEEEADELLARYFLNQPTNFFSSYLDMAAAIKNAYYYHLSVHRSFSLAQPKSLVTSFASNLFSYSEHLSKYISVIPDMFMLMRKAHQNTLTAGSICLNSDMTKVLVIAHTITPHLFAFPKGKIDEGETALMGAIRETKEEANFDVTPYINANHSFSYKRKSNAEGVFYFATQVPEFELEPAIPQEICKIGWVDVKTWKSDDGYDWTPDGPAKLILENQLPSFIEAQKQINNNMYI